MRPQPSELGLPTSHTVILTEGVSFDQKHTPQTPTEVIIHEASLQYDIPVRSSDTKVKMGDSRHEKDISVTSIINRATGEREYYAVTSISGVDDQSDWKIQSYKSETPTPLGPWKALGVAQFEGEATREMVATSILGTHAVVQTYCFREGGEIVYGQTTDHAETDDFLYFGNRRTLLKSEEGTKIANLYDPELTSIINENGEEEIYMTVTGVERYIDGKAKGGRIFLTRVSNDFQSASIVKPIIVEHIEDPEDAGALIVPAHIPTKKDGEWVPEGGKAFQIRHPDEIELKDDEISNHLLEKINNKIIFYGTCFAEGEDGNRQRGFLTIADAIDGEYTFVSLVHPVFGKGETGHGTVEVEWSPDGDISQAQLHILHQAREMGQNGEEGTWHQRRTTYNLVEFMEYAQKKQHEAIEQSPDKSLA